MAEKKCKNYEYGLDYGPDGTPIGRWLEPEREDGAARFFEPGTVKNGVFCPLALRVPNPRENTEPHIHTVDR
jgi:hypothetical protein